MLKAENTIPQFRYAVVRIFVLIVTAILIVRFFYLQVIQYENFSYRSDVNRIRAATLHAPRGLILDRYGRTIVDNSPTYILNVIPNSIDDKALLFKKLHNYINIDSVFLAANYEKYYRGRFAPVRLAKDLTFEQVSIIDEHRLELPGISYSQVNERSYSSEIRGSHFLGYLKEVDYKIRETLADQEYYEYGDLIGWKGLEKIYENPLRQIKGVTYYEVDAFGREMAQIKDRPDIVPIPGENLYTTIDLSLQKIAENQLAGRRGIILVSDPNSGEILVYVSKPDYDLTLFSGLTLREEWDNIVKDPGRPLLNRVTTGLYPPGSTLKLVTAAYLIDHRIISLDEKITCTGGYFLGDRTFRCWNRTGHGAVNLKEAVEQSCDVYFYTVIQRIALDDWSELCQQFGLSKKTGIDLVYERSGMVPDRAYMNSRYGRYGWSTGAKLNLTIGQGESLVTPIQMLVFVNLFATKGRTKIPHLALDYETDWVSTPKLAARTWRLCDLYLRGVVQSVNGTGRAADPKINGVSVSGKTGTAENPHGDPDAWFLGYANQGNKFVSVVVLVENAGHGGEVAAPIARSIFQFIFGDQKTAENVDVID